MVPLWDRILELIRNWFVFGDPLVFAGARSLHVTETLRKQEVKEIDLTKYGVPANAEVLYINFTSGGSALPTLLHGNAPILGPMPPRFSVLGLGGPDMTDDGPLSLSVVWHLFDRDDTTIRHLIEAAHEYQHSRFDGVVVPANIAAEAAITPVVALALRSFASKDRIEDFLQNAATYAHQVNVLLPVITHMVGVPDMPVHLRGILNRLRKLRNLIAHRGEALGQTRNDAAEHLTAAIFAARFAARLARVMKNNPLPHKAISHTSSED